VLQRILKSYNNFKMINAKLLYIYNFFVGLNLEKITIFFNFIQLGFKIKLLPKSSMFIAGMKKQNNLDAIWSKNE
jgi:hypothetical protein